MFVDPFTLAPISGAKYANAPVSIGETDGQYSIAIEADAEEAVFVDAVIEIGEDHPIRVGKSMSGAFETDSVFVLVDEILNLVPLERCRCFASFHILHHKNIWQLQKCHRQGAIKPMHSITNG
jgi:hypothetical protein